MLYFGSICYCLSHSFMLHSTVDISWECCWIFITIIVKNPFVKLPRIIHIMQPSIFCRYVKKIKRKWTRRKNLDICFCQNFMTVAKHSVMKRIMGTRLCPHAVLKLLNYVRFSSLTLLATFFAKAFRLDINFCFTCIVTSLY